MMTIKWKLTLNVVLVLCVVTVVVLASVIGMGFVKNRLFDLTEKSTPFQMRSMELQRAIHAATADLVKVGSALSQAELRTYRQEAETSLAQVKKAEEALEALQAGKKVGTHDELSSQARELLSVTEERLKIEEGALGANNELREKAKDVAQRLRGLDQKVKSLQSARASTYGKSMDSTNGIAGQLREMENIKLLMKELQVWCFELQNAQDKNGLQAMEFKGTGSITLAKSAAETIFKDSKNGGTSAVVEEMNTVTGKVGQLFSQKQALLEKPSPDSKKKYEELQGDILGRVNLLIALMDNEIQTANQKFSGEATQQAAIFGQVNKATRVLNATSELTSIGSSTEGMATRLFTVNSLKEVEELEAGLKTAFSRVEVVAKELDVTLAGLAAKEERQMLTNAAAGITSMKSLLLEQDGIVGKVQNQLVMKEKAIRAMGSLRDIVLKQAEQAKKTMATARGVQEQSIIEVNRMVLLSTRSVIIIGLIAVAFGIAFGVWIYRSISKPLSRLTRMTDEIAAGNLTHETAGVGRDEIGRVETAMGKMVGSLKEIVTKIHLATSSLASSAEELTATARTLDEGSEEQGTQVEEAAGAMAGMSRTTEEVAKSASETSQAAKAMKNKVESLGKSSEEIHNIVDLIKEIANQTNILALNAAIEAARAGDHGRGFAVVAENVRQLAKKTLAAAEDIARMIETMQKAIGHLDTSVKKQKDVSGKAAGRAEETIKSADGVVAYVVKVTDMINRIAVAMEEQSSTSHEVARNMENIAGVTRELRGSSEGMTGTAEELSKIASELSETAGWFKV
jgi:methyl-accepting chemotaxis protein